MTNSKTLITIIIFSLTLLIAGCTNPPIQDKCGDGICNEKEKANPKLCPEDCQPTTKECKKENEICGRIAGYMCCSGLTCKYGGDHPDTRGICEKEEGEKETCLENWQCTDWSDCTNSQQTRTCTDSNDCDTTNEKPSTGQNCEEPSSPIDSPFGAHGYYKIISDISDIGVKYKRNTANEGFVWDLIEPNLDGNYDWNDIDEKVNTAEFYGLNLMVNIKGYNRKDQALCNDCDPNSDRCDSRKPCDMDKYKKFISAVIKRYKYKIKYYQFENEPSERSKYFGDTPENYAEVLEAAYSVIKAECPDCKVLMAGSAGFRKGGYHSDVLSILDGKSFDIFDVHAGGGATGGYENLENFYSAIKSEFSKLGIDKPIWSTEFGSLAADKGSCQTTEEDAQNLIKLYTTALDLGFEKLFWRVSECPSGIIDKNKEKTKTYYAYETLINKLEEFSSINKITDGQYRFNVDGKKVYVLWCESGSCVLPSGITGTVTVTDSQGNENIVNANQIILTESPVFIEEN